MKETIEIGSVPCDEACAQVGDPNYGVLAYAECKRFIELIRKVCGSEPEGARLRIKRNMHDFGEYFEVAVTFEDSNSAAVDYAYGVEANAPMTWDAEPIDPREMALQIASAAIMEG